MEHSKFRFPLLFWVALLTTASLLPVRYKIALHTTNNHHFLHPAFHVSSFLVLSLLSAPFANQPWKRLLACLCSISFGIFLELAEHLVYHQRLELYDMRLDAYGTVLGLFALEFASRRITTSQAQQVDVSKPV